MSAEPIYHLALLCDWDPSADEYVGSTIGKSLRDVGFVHCSTAGQVQQIADLLYRGRDDVVLLEIDPDRLNVPVRYEAVVNGEIFPHVYGPVRTTAVVSATPVKPGKDGRLRLGQSL